MAHRQLIVHRDIKPGNVLVDQTGQVKLLDFGIAKLLGTEQRGTAASIEILATPEYASPEQMRGEVVTTASDLYSLGKLMEVLLPGAKGELRSILRKATHEEAERRYRSVEQLGEDLRRYLGGFPVLAQPDSWWYRTRKFVRRNPVGAVAASIAILSIVTGVVATRREQLRTERRFNEVREIATSFLFEFHDSVEKLPGSMEARRLLVTRALKYLELLSSESRDEALQADVAAAYGKVSRMQWRGGGSHLGDPAGARESALREVALLEQLLVAKPADRLRRMELASALSRLAEVTATGLAKAKDAVTPTQRAVGLLDSVLREAAEDPEVLERVAAGHAQLGNLRMRLGDPKQALEEFRKAAGWRETLQRLRPGDLWNQRMLGWMYVYAGDALGGGGAEVHLGDRQGALESTMKGERVFEALAQAHNIAAARDLNVSRTRIAGVQEMMGHFEEALRWRKVTLQQAIESAKQDPLDADAARSVGLNYHGTGLLLMKMGRHDEAEAMVRAGMKGGNGSIEAVMDQANLEHLMGELSRRRKQAGPAVQHMQAAIALREPHLRGSADSRLRWRQAKSFEGLAEAQLMAGQRSAAADAFEAALAIYLDLQKSGTLSPGETGTPAALAARVSELRR
jgi:tetratricopeptide (TPR) repeat protein